MFQGTDCIVYPLPTSERPDVAQLYGFEGERDLFFHIEGALGTVQFYPTVLPDPVNRIL